MKKIFTPEFIGQFILQVIAVGIIIFLVQGYFNNKWQPLTAAETLKKENFLNAKRDTYYQAIDILNRNLAHTSFTVGGKLVDTINSNIGGSYPSDIEINTCFSKLCIYSDNPKIPLTYQKLFLNDTAMKPVLEMVTFINLVRQDLGYGVAIIDTAGDRYKFIQTHRKR